MRKTEPVMRLLAALASSALLAGLLAGCTAGAERGVGAATGQIDGAVVDRTLHPFGGLKVHLSPLDREDTTSPLGGFTFRNLPAGSYTVIASSPGTLGAGAIVNVEPGKVSRVILQLLPVPTVLPYIETLGHRSNAQFAFPGDECGECSWTIPLEKHPDELVLQARWNSIPEGQGTVIMQVYDDRGRFVTAVQDNSLLWTAVSGEDIETDASSLTVSITFGNDFTPRYGFQMQSSATLYYGATRAELFS